MEMVLPTQADDPVSQLRGYRSNRGLAIAIIVLLAIHASLSVVLSLSWPNVGSLLGGAEPEGLGQAIVALAVGFAAILQGCIFIATAVCFLVWLYKAYANLPALGSESLIFSPKSAVIGWFIPFVNLVQGYKSVHTLYLESQPRPNTLETGFAIPKSARIVGFWWGAYLLRGIVSRIADRMSEHDFSGAVGWLVTSELLDIVAAVLCILIVYRIEKRQHDQHDDLVRRIPQPIPSDRLR